MWAGPGQSWVELRRVCGSALLGAVEDDSDLYSPLSSPDPPPTGTGTLLTTSVPRVKGGYMELGAQ